MLSFMTIIKPDITFLGFNLLQDLIIITPIFSKMTRQIRPSIINKDFETSGICCFWSMELYNSNTIQSRWSKDTKCHLKLTILLVINYIWRKCWKMMTLINHWNLWWRKILIQFLHDTGTEVELGLKKNWLPCPRGKKLWKIPYTF